MDTIINDAIRYITDLFASDASGHGADHTLRVYRTALKLAAAEGADEETVALARRPRPTRWGSLPRTA